MNINRMNDTTGYKEELTLEGYYKKKIKELERQLKEVDKIVKKSKKARTVEDAYELMGDLQDIRDRHKNKNRRKR